jgi:hypothetical protein
MSDSLKKKANQNRNKEKKYDMDQDFLAELLANIEEDSGSKNKSEQESDKIRVVKKIKKKVVKKDVLDSIAEKILNIDALIIADKLPHNDCIVATKKTKKIPSNDVLNTDKIDTDGDDKIDSINSNDNNNSRDNDKVVSLEKVSDDEAVLFDCSTIVFPIECSEENADMIIEVVDIKEDIGNNLSVEVKGVLETVVQVVEDVEGSLSSQNGVDTHSTTDSNVNDTDSSDAIIAADISADPVDSDPLHSGAKPFPSDAKPLSSDAKPLPSDAIPLPFDPNPLPSSLSDIDTTPIDTQAVIPVSEVSTIDNNINNNTNIDMNNEASIDKNSKAIDDKKIVFPTNVTIIKKEVKRIDKKEFCINCREIEQQFGEKTTPLLPRGFTNSGLLYICIYICMYPTSDLFCF